MNSTDRMKGSARVVSDPTRIIGIAGIARSGKDTVADMIQAELNKDRLPFASSWERYSLAGPLKEMLHVGLGLTDKDPLAEPLYGVSYRTLAQTLGTEWAREMICDDIWLRIATRRTAGKSVIISDLRFENEADWVRKAGGLVIHIERRGQERIAESGHKTEAGIAARHGDYKILNCGTLEDLQRVISKQVAPDLLDILDHKLAWGLEEGMLGKEAPTIVDKGPAAEQQILAITGAQEPNLQDIAGWNLEAYKAEHGSVGHCPSQCGRKMPCVTDPICGKCQDMRKNAKAVAKAVDHLASLGDPCTNCKEACGECDHQKRHQSGDKFGNPKFSS